ncbi:hypothetical protein NA57DRAFT_53287 [Rhizodiscina lignyota]|uniref:Uncharacterized protein n=1 Tax=Rhizodiscina lignyota TaxID=1504668 RepID=A0A9P4IJV1_9PEZI|nr:hypothetical protein NA57DRAFT_53287 [Rhizodiscina lignyota]
MSSDQSELFEVVQTALSSEKLKKSEAHVELFVLCTELSLQSSLWQSGSDSLSSAPNTNSFYSLPSSYSTPLSSFSSSNPSSASSSAYASAATTPAPSAGTTPYLYQHVPLSSSADRKRQLPAGSFSWGHSPSNMAQPGFDGETRRKKRKSSSSKSRDFNLTPSSTSSRYYKRADSAVSTSPPPSYQASPAATGVPPHPYPLALPTPPDSPMVDTKEPAQLVFHIYKTSPIFSRRTYDITLPDKRSPAFHVSFPPTALGMSGKPNIMVQRGTESGPVIGEVRFRSMFSPEEIHLTGFGRSSPPESTTVSSDGLFSRRKRVHFAGKDWFWKGTSSKAAGGHKGGGEGMIGGHLKCTDESGEVVALITRTPSPSKVGRIAITKRDLTDREIEGIVVTGLAVLEKDERNSGVDGGSS